MNVTVFGAGGMGLYFAAMLARVGHRVTVVGRESTVEAAREPLVLGHGAVEISVPGVRAITEIPADAEPADLIVVAVKAWQVADAAAALRPLIGPHTVVLPVQNGVEAPADLAAVLGTQHILGCTCVVIAQRLAPWQVRCLGAHATVEIGALTADSHRPDDAWDPVGEVSTVLTAAGIGVTRSTRWCPCRESNRPGARSRAR
ncbi:ketopantoate reductase family protein, partial [Nocardia sp. NPDC004722]